MQTIEQDIRQFIIDNFLFGELDAELSNNESLLDRGIIDSTGVLELVAFLEDTYKMNIQDDELIPKNLDSVNNLVEFVNHKLHK